MRLHDLPESVCVAVADLGQVIVILLLDVEVAAVFVCTEIQFKLVHFDFLFSVSWFKQYARCVTRHRWRGSKISTRVVPRIETRLWLPASPGQGRSLRSSPKPPYPRTGISRAGLDGLTPERECLF